MWKKPASDFSWLSTKIGCCAYDSSNSVVDGSCRTSSDDGRPRPPRPGREQRRHPRHRRRLEQLAERHLDLESFAEHDLKLGQQERMTAQPEEISVAADALHAEQLLPDVCQVALQFRLR